MYISNLRLSCAQNFDNDDELGSGSGMIDESPDGDTSGRGVAYKRIELKFATKFQFSNSPNSADFLAEVVEQLLYALNRNGGPNPKEAHRPAMTNTNEITFEPNFRGRRDASEGGVTRTKANRFRVFVWVPVETDVDEYLTRLKSPDGSSSNTGFSGRDKSGFFNSIRHIKSSDSEETKIVSEGELKRFEAERLPAQPNNNGGGIEIDPIDNGNSGMVSPRPNPNGGGGGSGNRENTVVVDYKAYPEDFFRNPATLAAMIAGALAGLLCTILCTIFVVYRMRKKDEGSYALDEPKNSYKYKHDYYIASATKEFFA